MSYKLTIETEILSLINQHRALKNLPPLTFHKTVYEHSLQHANNIASKNVPFGHHGFADRIKSLHQDLKLTAATENVAMGQKTAEEVVNSWISSNKHRQNIEGSFNLTGIAATQDTEGITVYTQIFAQSLEDILEDNIEEDQFYLVSSKASNSLNNKILLFINEYRIKQQLMPLTVKSEIVEAAQLHAQNMAENHAPLGHEGFEIRAQKIILQLNAQQVGENVALGPADPKAIIDSWLNSPKHLKNIEGNFAYTGIAAVSKNDQEVYYCQIFVQ